MECVRYYKVSLCENFQRLSSSVTISLATVVKPTATSTSQYSPNTSSHKITVLEHASRGLSAIAGLLVLLEMSYFMRRLGVDSRDCNREALATFKVS